MSATTAKHAPHPLAELIPLMSDDKYRELRDDIAAHGQREAITLYEGKVLDGRHRARACEELGIEPRVREYDGVEPIVFVLSMNVHRRHLTTAQRAEIARAVLPHLREAAKGRMLAGVETEPRGHESTGLAREQAGKLVGVSGRTVAELDAIAREAPDLHEQVKGGEKGVREAWKESRARRNGSGAAPVSLTTGRQRAVAAKARLRLERAVGNCNALARGLDGIRAEDAAAVASEEEVAGWIEAFGSAGAALRRMQRRLQEAR